MNNTTVLNDTRRAMPSAAPMTTSRVRNVKSESVARSTAIAKSTPALNAECPDGNASECPQEPRSISAGPVRPMTCFRIDTTTAVAKNARSGNDARKSCFFVRRWISP